MTRPQASAGKSKWGLALIIAVFCMLGAANSILVPLFEAPDEVWHFSFIHTLTTEGAIPVRDPGAGNAVAMWLRESGQPPLYHGLMALAVAPLDMADFPGIVRFNPDHPAVTAHSDSRAPNLFIHTRQEAFPYRGAVLAVHLVRLLTLLWGAGTLLGVYLVAREIVPQHPGRALAAVAVTAFNPHFIFINSVANNDAAIACLATLVLWLAIRLARGNTTRRQETGLGLLLGLALLSKVSALALPVLVLGALGLRWWQNRNGRLALAGTGRVLGPALLVAGWWYGRNWWLYGDPLAWDVWLADIGTHTLTLPQLLHQFTSVGRTFWEPYNGLLPRPGIWALAGLLALAATGWMRMAWQVTQRRLPVAPVPLLVAATWFVMVFASLVRYMLTTPAAQGRLLFPATASLSVLLVLGWDALLPRRWSRPGLATIGAGLLALSIATPIIAIAPRFPHPLVDDPAGLSLTHFGNAQNRQAIAEAANARLLGATLAPDPARTGQEIRLSLYWDVQALPPPDLGAVVQVWTRGGYLLYQRDTPPGRGFYPPDLWQAGDVVRDPIWLVLNDGAPAGLSITVQVKRGDEVVAQASTPAAFTLLPTSPPESIPHPLDYRLGDAIKLEGYDVGAPTEDGRLPLILYWRAEEEIGEDYTVFVHLLDEEGTLLAQADGPPRRGDYPTSRWQPGQPIPDERLLPIPPQWPGRVQVGLYRLEDGARLPVTDPAGVRVPGDAILLEQLGDVHK